MTVLDWMLDADPSIRWQALRDLAGAPPEVVATERARVATEGWGAQLLARQGEDGQWAGGARFPADGWPDRSVGQPWTATEPTLTLLRAFGVDPGDERVRRAVARVADHCRWEHDAEPFFAGEAEPCINGRVVALGVYFGQNVDGVVAVCLSEQLEDGGWNCEAEYGSVRSSLSTKRSSRSDRSDSPTAGGCWRTPIAARSTSRWRTAMADPAGGTRSGRCASSPGAGRTLSLSRASR